ARGWLLSEFGPDVVAAFEEYRNESGGTENPAPFREALRERWGIDLGPPRARSYAPPFSRINPASSIPHAIASAPTTATMQALATSATRAPKPRVSQAASRAVSRDS